MDWLRSAPIVERIQLALEILALASLALLAAADWLEHRCEASHAEGARRRFRIAAVVSLLLLALFDVGAFVFHRYADHLREPRRLQLQAKEKLVHWLKKKEGRTVVVQGLTDDTESRFFAKEIAAAITEAGWHVERQTLMGAEAVGLVVLVGGNNPENEGCHFEFDSTAYVLGHALKESGLGAAIECVRRGDPSTPERPTLVVGRNPNSAEGRLTIDRTPQSEVIDGRQFPPPP